MRLKSVKLAAAGVRGGRRRRLRRTRRAASGDVSYSGVLLASGDDNYFEVLFGVILQSRLEVGPFHLLPGYPVPGGYPVGPYPLNG